MKHCDPSYFASFLVYPSNFSGLVYFSIIPAIENDKLALRYINDRISIFIEVPCSMNIARRTAFVPPFQKPFIFYLQTAIH